MDVEEFRECGKQMVDYICEYLTTINTKKVFSNVEPGYLRKLLPDEAPQEPEEWDKIMKDIETAIMPGVTHWQHPRFHAYLPNGLSFPSILADMLADATGCVAFSWIASPSCTELETIIMDWLGKALSLPDHFIVTKGSKGGGVIQGSTSDCLFFTMIAARNYAISCLKEPNDTSDDSKFIQKLVAYTSSHAHACVEKAAKSLLIKIRILEPDEKGSLRGDTVKKAIKEDKAKGLVPFFVTATLGTIESVSFDNLTEIGEVCNKECCMWFHIDAAYAGCAFICPELRHLMKGIEYADSFSINTNKWLLITFDCSCLWIKDQIKYTKAFIIDPLYLRHANESVVIDYRHWCNSLTRRFRSLKLWFVFRTYGISGLQKYIRNHINLAKEFEKILLQDDRFEVLNEVILGVVCFRIKNASDKINQTLLALINESEKIYMTPAMVKGKYVIRFCVCHEHTTIEDIQYAFDVISEYATMVLNNTKLSKEQLEKMSCIRFVTKEDYDKGKSKLPDGVTPILVYETCQAACPK